jgi:beta-N-acetylhexosaminidase
MFESFLGQAAHRVSAWSLEEKVGQLFILAFPGKDAEAARPLIERYNLGGCYLSQDNAATFDEARALTSALGRIARQRHSAPPLLLGVDQEGAWSVLTPQSTTGPGNLALGSADQPALTAAMYQLFGVEMRSAGFNCVLGPCADVNLNGASQIIDTRSFGAPPERVAMHVAAAIGGAHAGGIVACAKHFPGHGDTAADTHREIPQVDKSLARLLREDLAPFKAAVEAGVELIMSSHIRYPRIDPLHPATLSAPILRGVLRERLGFAGIVISDSMNMGAIRHNYAPVEAAILAFQSGIDMIMLSEEHYDHDSAYLDNQLAMIGAVVAAVADGRIGVAELDRIVTRVVAFKLARLAPMALHQPYDEGAHRHTEQLAAAAALKLLADPAGNLPLSAARQLIVVQTSPLAAYANLRNARGIGPNQGVPAFDYFLSQLGAGVDAARLRVLSHAAAYAWLEQVRVLPDQLVLAVMENYPLPGEDFAQQEARALLAALGRTFGRQLLVVGLRNDDSDVPPQAGHLCAFGSRECSARAAAQACLDGAFGIAEAGEEGGDRLRRG